jgi:hypothetical protein
MGSRGTMTEVELFAVPMLLVVIGVCCVLIALGY